MRQNQYAFFRQNKYSISTNILENKQFVCEKCDKKFKKVKYLKEHLKRKICAKEENNMMEMENDKEPDELREKK